jgi:hypothetical protein
MIYFIKDAVTQAVKIGYSKNAKKRLNGLQTATPNQLVLLGTIPGGLEHEAEFHRRFEKLQLQGEWFKADVLPEVLAIIASASQQVKMNVIVVGDIYFHNKPVVFQTLAEIHAKTPIAWVITSGDRFIDRHAWEWAKENGARVHYFYPKWKTHGRYAPFKLGPQMLRSMFDPKTLVVFLTERKSQSTEALITRAAKAGIPVVRVEQPSLLV